jgi:flagellar biosynthesis GTPase FlhF
MSKSGAVIDHAEYSEADNLYTINIGDENLCRCGCGREVSEKSNFVPGHDAKLKAILIAAHLKGAQLGVLNGGSLQTGSAMSWAEKRSWGHFLRSAEQTAKDREAVAARVAERIALKESREAEKQAKATERKAELEQRKQQREEGKAARAQERKDKAAAREAEKAAKTAEREQAKLEEWRRDIGTNVTFKVNRVEYTGDVVEHYDDDKGVKFEVVQPITRKGEAIEGESDTLTINRKQAGLA